MVIHRNNISRINIEVTGENIYMTPLSIQLQLISYSFSLCHMLFCIFLTYSPSWYYFISWNFLSTLSLIEQRQLHTLYQRCSSFLSPFSHSSVFFWEHVMRTAHNSQCGCAGDFFMTELFWFSKHLLSIVRLLSCSKHWPNIFKD